MPTRSSLWKLRHLRTSPLPGGFDVPEGTTVKVTGDLVINAADHIFIRGRMLLDPGVSLSLLAGGP
jgi:hypothetical protein